MALSSCFSSSQVCFSLKVDRPRLPANSLRNRIVSKRCISGLESKKCEMFGKQVVGKEVNQCIVWNFLGGSKTLSRTNIERNITCRKSSAVYASWLSSSEIASGAFTLGTAAVLPIYAFMVLAPHTEFTKKIAASSTPFVALGVLYGYLLYLSWTPDTMRLMFASKYWLPELSGIAKMFTNEMTLASAWIHLLAVDLFAARQVYHNGLQENIETRHSVSLCLLFCPIGILSHVITKALTQNREVTEQDFIDEVKILSDSFKD